MKFQSHWKTMDMIFFTRLIQKITNPKYSIDLIWLNIMIDSEDVSFQRMIEFEQLLKKIDQKIPIIIYSGLDLNFKVRKPEYIYYEKDHCKIKDFIDKHRTNWKHLIKHQVDNKDFPNIVEDMIGHDNLQHKYDMSIKTKTILFLGANPIDTIHLRLGEEVREITENLRLSKERDSLIFKQEWAVTTDSLMQAILDENPYILHFSGHGETEGICLEYSDRTAHIINTEIICSLFRLFNTVKCVLLNCCYSKSQAESIIKYIPYVVGMPSCIKDEASIAFSVGFYKALGAGICKRKDIRMMQLFQFYWLRTEIFYHNKNKIFRSSIFFKELTFIRTTATASAVATPT